ncbi:MOSC domain-containing protein [Bdellovibrio sp. NC01]|uniref:MOSC domain-containing protein n=1 Tax=Bdellovibrio sp. NC01 TaxID=2220073 RepID=UPI00115AF596|nr:MOSC N-terminal beta barrel domain-containing protein [Bdellovibrio sp. NC01]QDK38232.1 MOSC domain-containing protein [Bdellovibrio sp. NC01]
MRIEELFIYPIKSARGQAVKDMKITHEGPEGDRQWMLIDENGKFVSQRTVPKLATVEVFNDQAALTVGFQKMFFKISKNNSFQRKVKVSVWNDTFEAALEPDLYSQGLSQYLGTNCRLVRYAPYSQRRVLSHQADWKPEVRFSDGRPLLLVNTKSLEDLNGRLRTPVGVDRFRPNIVFQGGQAFEEESWKKIKIGEVVFSLPKKCARCAIITIDQKTGEKTGAEPLKTLASYRRDDKGVNFGVLWIPENEGQIKIGDTLEVLE